MNRTLWIAQWGVRRLAYPLSNPINSARNHCKSDSKFLLTVPLRQRATTSSCRSCLGQNSADPLDFDAVQKGLPLLPQTYSVILEVFTPGGRALHRLCQFIHLRSKRTWSAYKRSFSCFLLGFSGKDRLAARQNVVSIRRSPPALRLSLPPSLPWPATPLAGVFGERIACSPFPLEL